MIGLEKQEDFVWIWFQSESKEALQQAYMTVNTVVSRECKIIPLAQPETISNENMKNHILIQQTTYMIIVFTFFYTRCVLSTICLSTFAKVFPL